MRSRVGRAIIQALPRTCLAWGAERFPRRRSDFGMLIGPIFTREVVIAPRRSRLYVARTTYVAALLMLMCTAWLVLAGTQVVRNVGDLARFGALVFQVLAVVQLVLAVSFSALLAASAVAQEKDRRTLVLLLLTRLTNSELVLGKLFAGLLSVLALIGASLPVFMATALFGGVSFEQIGRVFLVTLVAAVVAGSIGSTIALWRDSTYQTLALTVLVLVAWIAAGEAIAHGVFGGAWWGISTEVWAAGLSPWQAIQAAARPILRARRDRFRTWAAPSTCLPPWPAGSGPGDQRLAIGLVRVWNPSREAQPRIDETPDRESIWGVQYDLATAGTASRLPPRRRRGHPDCVPADCRSDHSARRRWAARSTPRRANRARCGTIRSCGERFAPGPMAAKC